MKIVPILVIMLSLTGCLDAQMAKVRAIGSSAEVTCFSGEKVIYHGKSSGKVISEENSDGYFFRDKGTKQTVEVSGNCIIVYDN